jgi:uncharacterized protein with HEPN domain
MFFSILFKNRVGMSSVVENLPVVGEALGSIPNTAKINKQKPNHLKSRK